MANPINLEPGLNFLDDLSRNNNKTWFDAHRSDYESARAAFEELVDDLISEFRQPDNLEGLRARNCIARIYRDVRFSHDKSPYKTNLGAMIAPGGWKAAALGYYLHLEPRQSMAAGGLYNPTPEQLERFRQAVVADPGEIDQITSAGPFVEIFGAIEGERLKTAPKGYDRTHPQISLLQLKQVTVIHRYTDQEALSPAFEQQVITAFRAMRPFLDYLTEILR
jgi:uncharacterized protein (TIGR02453 family)